MKIALFHNVVSGGAKRAIYDCCRILKLNGHKIDLFIMDTADSEFLPLDDFIDNKYLFSGKKFLPEYTDRSFKSMPKWLFSQYMLNKTHISIARQINEGGYDICFTHLCVYTQAPYILRYLKVPSLYYCNEPLRIAYEEAIDSRRKNIISILCDIYSRFFLLNEEKKNVLASTAVITNSFFTREYILRAYGINSFVSYFGVDTNKFKQIVDIEKENMVLSVGAFHPRKGFRFLIRAISKIDKAIRPKLVIIGDKQYYNEEKVLYDLAIEFGVELEMFYKKSEEELLNYYNKAKVFVYAPHLEPFGLVVLEAMACGLPVVAVCEGGVREVVKDGYCGILTQRDEDEFSEAVKYLLSNTQRNKEFGIKARECVENNWTWQKSYKMLIKNFKRVILYKDRQGK